MSSSARHRNLAFCAPGCLVAWVLWATGLATAWSDQASWEPFQGTLQKVGFSSAAATYDWVPALGNNRVRVDLRHVGTSHDGFSYSKWEIDRWGDPEGVWLAPGSWQVTSNTRNDVVLGVWGYWGWDGAEGSPKAARGDSTAYEVTLSFEKPVRHLRFPVHGLNALLTASGQNSRDQLAIAASLAGQAASVTVERLGHGLFQEGASVRALWENAADASSNLSDDGSVFLFFPETVDRVILTYGNEANHPDPAAYKAGSQAWAFSVGALSYQTVKTGKAMAETLIDLESDQGALEKSGYTDETASLTMVTVDGGVRATYSLDFVGKTPGLISYSKWEINRWGDPTGQSFAPGSWQMMTNAKNDIVLGLWGYWGGEGSDNSQRTQMGDYVSYRLKIAFDRPVSHLRLPVNGINGFLKPSKGFNSADHLTVTASLDGATVTPRFANRGDAFQISGNQLVGDYLNQINDPISGQHVSDKGSCEVQFDEPVNEVTLTFVNVAGHHDPALFQDGQQTWSFSLGSPRFQYDPTAGFQNLASLAGSTVKQSSSLTKSVTAERAVDGDANGNYWDGSVAHTAYETAPWLEIDLGANRKIDRVEIWRRTDDMESALDDAALYVSSTPFVSAPEATPGVGVFSLTKAYPVDVVLPGRSGRYLRIQRTSPGFLAIAEVRVYGPKAAGDIVMKREHDSEVTADAFGNSVHPGLDPVAAYALDAQAFPLGFSLDTEGDDGVVLQFDCPHGMDAFFDYELLCSNDLATWQIVSLERATRDRLSGRDRFTLSGVDGLMAGMEAKGFVRLCIRSKGKPWESLTPVCGWMRTECHPGYQTFGASLTMLPLFSGKVMNIVDDRLYPFLEGEQTVLPSVDRPSYVEFVSGPLEGHRIEVLADSSSGDSVRLDLSNSRNTLTEVPMSAFQGAAFVLRPHWTFSDLFPVANFTASADPAMADQVIAHTEDGYDSYFLLRAPGSPYWTSSTGVALTDAGDRVVAPGEGLFIRCQSAARCYIVGQVRDNLFRQNLRKGLNFIAEGYPVALSPARRGLAESNGFLGSVTPDDADQIHLWRGDDNPGQGGYAGYFYLSTPVRTGWAEITDSELTLQDEAKLFRPDRAVFLTLVDEPHEAYQMSRPWRP